MTALLSHIAALVARRPRVATLTVFLTIIGLIGGAIAVGGAFKDDFTVPGIESQRAHDLLEQRFPAQSGTSATLVFRGDLKAADQALTAIARQPHVASVDPLQTAKDGHTAYAVVNYDQPATALDASARERLESATKGLDVAMAGEPIDGAATGGFPIGELIGLAVAVLLLLAVLRNLRAAGNALMAAFAGIALGFGALMWAAAATEVPGLAPTLAGMLGLGAGIDYALLLAARQQEELRAGRTPAEGRAARQRHGRPLRADGRRDRAGLDLRPARDRDPVRRPCRRRRRARRAGLRDRVRRPAPRPLRPLRRAHAPAPRAQVRHAPCSLGDAAPLARTDRRRRRDRRARSARGRPRTRPAGRPQPLDHHYPAPGV